MKKCKKYKKSMILFFYNELGKNSSIKLHRHLKECPGCKARFEELKGSALLCYEAENVDVPEINWNTFWQKFNQNLNQARFIPKKTSTRFPGFILGPAAISLIFVVGIIVGKYFISAPSSQTGFQLTNNNIYSTVKEHFDNIKPVLIEYSNYPEFSNRKNNLILDRSRASNLLVQNHLLQQRLGRDHDQLLIQLLGELEIVLTDLSNLSEREYRNLKIINNFIKIKGILLKLEVFRLQAKKGGVVQNEIF